MNKITLLFFTFLCSLCGFAQLTEGFEGTFPPTGWAVFNVAGTNFTWAPNDPLNPLQQAYAGTGAAYLQRENVATGTTEDWLVTPYVTAPANPQLRFYSKLTIAGNQGNIYQIRLSENADQAAMGNYTIIQTWTETQINPTQEAWTEKVVDLPASVAQGDQFYIAFVMLSDNGDRWLIDNVSIVEECLIPTAQAVTTVTDNSAILNWTNPGNITSWEIEIVENSVAFTGVGVPYTGLPPYTATPLLPATVYKYKVRAVCGPGHTSDWSNPISFTTLFQPPPNDNCANAIALTVNPTNICGVSTPGTVNAATASPESSTCTGTEDDDVWYTFVATGPTHLINLNNVVGSTTDLVHAVYSGTGCGTLTQMYCSDPNNSTATGLIAGNTYFVRVYSWSAAAQTTAFNICIGTPPPPPANDNCATATVVPVNPDLLCAAFVTGTIYSATASPEANTCAGTDDDDIWFEFVATSTSHTINLNNITGGTTDLFHVVYSGSVCGSLTQLYCSDPNNSIAGNLTIGATYKVRVYSNTATAGQTSVFDICIGTPPPPPANDNCATAIVAPVNPTLVCAQTVPGTVAWATPSLEGGTSCTGTEDDDVWYTFTATHVSHTINFNNVAGSTTDLVHAVYSGASCGALTQMYCSDPNNSIAGNLVPGQTYFVRVFSWTATSGQTSTFDLCIGTPPPPPANDTCAGAITAPVNPDLLCAQTVPGTVAWATTSSEATTCGGTRDDDVWYKFTATNTMHTIEVKDVAGSTTDLFHVVYSGNNCGALTQLYCSDPNNSIATNLTIGQTYYIRVYTWTATGGQTSTFNLCIGTPPPPPANDTCAGAIVAPVNPDLLCGQTVPGTIAWATGSSEATTCGGTKDDDVWYTFTATNAIHTIDLRDVAGSTTDLFHVVYSGNNCGALTQLYCSDPNNSIATGLVVGQTYYIRIYSWTATAGQTTTFNVCIGTPPPPPVNDQCADAIPVPVNPTHICAQTVPGTIAWATASPEGGTACAGTEDDDVWFEFVATNPIHLISFINVAGSTTDLNHTLYTGNQCGTMTQVYCNANNNSTATGLTVGQTYKIRVFTATATMGQTTTFDVCVGTPPPPPVNDDCANAISVPVNPTMDCVQTVDGILYSATASPEANTCGGTDDDDVWFEFVATNTAHIISLLNVTGSTTDLFHVVYAGNQCGSLTQLLCSDPNSSIIQGLTVGQTYKVRVYSWTATAGQTSEFDICVSTPPTPGTNDNCADAIVVPVNQNSTCELTASGTLFGATASAEANTCGGTDDDDVWFEFVATHTTHLISLTNIQGSTTDLFHVLYSGNQCGTMTQLYCSDPNGSVATGLIIGNTYKIRVYSWTATAPQTTTFDVCVRIPNTPITVSETQYTVPQLVTDVLIDSDCALVSNITWSTGSNFGQANGIGYFDAASSDFPFQNGVILATSSIQEAVGGAAGGATGWPGDTQLNAIVTANEPSQTAGLQNASIIEFDFVPLTNQFTFDFLFASDEYGTFQCGFSDAFAFILTGPLPGTTWQNLAVIPETNIPVAVTTIRNNAFNTSCASANVSYFGQFNQNDPQAAAIFYNGQTVPMQASADVIAGQQYHIKLVIADYSDTAFNSAVFLGGGSFDIGDIDLGGDLVLTEGTALCDEETITLDTELDPNSFTFVWTKDTAVIPGATSPSLTVTEPGVYNVVASFPNIACSYEGEVTIEFYPNIEEITGDPLDLTYCDPSGFHTFDLTSNADIILAPLPNPDIYTVDFYLTEADALADDNPITNFTAFTNTVPNLQTIYTRILNQQGGCIAIKTFDLIIQDLTPQFDITDDLILCGTSTGSITVTPINFDPTSPDVTFVWTYGTTTLPDTDESIVTAGDGTYTVTISNTECTATASVNVTSNPTPVAAITYNGSPFCSNELTGAVIQTGDAGGVYSSTAGLIINPATGEINIAASETGTFTVTYTIAATPSCPELIVTTQVIIFEAPGASIVYSGSPYCADAGTATVTQTGTTGGAYSSTIGLVIDPATGEIDLDASTAGTYTVTYSIAPTADCNGSTVSTQIIITQLPVATITYNGTPYCSNSGTATVTQTGNTGGTYSSADGLSIDAATGEINLGASVAGNYTVTYTIEAANGCQAVTTTADVTVTALPEAVFSYDSASFCQNASIATPTYDGAAGPGTFEVVPATGLSINPATGVIDPATSDEGTYTVTNKIAAANGCPEVTHSVTVTINPAPIGTFSYGSVAYCQDEETNPSPILAGEAGTFSATPAGLSIDPATGIIDLANSAAGSYTVINAIAATPECAAVNFETTVVISATPVFTIVGGCENNVYSLTVIPAAGTFDASEANYSWSGPSGLVDSGVGVFSIVPAVEGTYTVTVSTASSCVDAQSFPVDSTSCFIQRGISPGDSDKNNEFDLTALNVKHLSIFNRYGQEVYSRSNYTKEWVGQDKKGNELPTGTYFYSIERENGETKTGWVYINRQN